MTEQIDHLSVGFVELAGVIREVEGSGLTFTQYLNGLRKSVVEAERKLKTAERVAGLCSATKVRRTRCDKGKPRKPESEAQQ